MTVRHYQCVWTLFPDWKQECGNSHETMTCITCPTKTRRIFDSHLNTFSKNFTCKVVCYSRISAKEKKKNRPLHEDFFLLAPPSTVISCPDMKPALTRYSTASAMSLGLPARFVRWSSTSALSFCSAHRSRFSSPSRHSCATFTRPGATRLTRIPHLDTRTIIHKSASIEPLHHV